MKEYSGLCFFSSFISIFHSGSNLLLPWEVGVHRVGSSLSRTPIPVLLLVEVLGFLGLKKASLRLCRKLRDSAFVLKWGDKQSNFFSERLRFLLVSVLSMKS